MTRLKNYAIIALFVLLAALAFAYKLQREKLLNEKANNERLELNQSRLLSEKKQNIELNLTMKEWLKQKSDSIKAFEKANKIRPRTVIRYTERIFTDEITVPKLVPVSLVSKNTWEIKDSTGCFFWKGTAYLSGESLKVVRGYFSYENTTQELLHREKKGRFLFWDTYYKDRFTLTSKSGCGNELTKTINVIR